ncbi:MAG: hypothetical protein IJM46_10480, partial [Oscillospiraceae bacterium]|nr:hypothetical protein [Oscillospiraceae bacterium]
HLRKDRQPPLFYSVYIPFLCSDLVFCLIFCVISPSALLAEGLCGQAEGSTVNCRALIIDPSETPYSSSGMSKLFHTSRIYVIFAGKCRNNIGTMYESTAFFEVHNEAFQAYRLDILKPRISNIKKALE